MYELGEDYSFFWEGLMYISVFTLLLLAIQGIASFYYGHTPTKMKGKLAAEKTSDEKSANAQVMQNNDITPPH